MFHAARCVEAEECRSKVHQAGMGARCKCKMRRQASQKRSCCAGKAAGTGEFIYPFLIRDRLRCGRGRAWDLRTRAARDDPVPHAGELQAGTQTVAHADESRSMPGTGAGVTLGASSPFASTRTLRALVFTRCAAAAQGLAVCCLLPSRPA